MRKAQKETVFLLLDFIVYGHTVAGGLRQRLRKHQNFPEASLLSKTAATQRTRVQRLSPENKGGFPYTTFSAGHRNGSGAACPKYNHTSFHWPL
jgi:hypothetical protein